MASNISGRWRWNYRRTGKKIATVRKEVRVNAGAGREAAGEAGDTGTENEETGKAETVNAGAEGEELKADAAGSEGPAFNLQSNTPLPTW